MTSCTDDEVVACAGDEMTIPNGAYLIGGDE
jgi:hypothetical protein